MSLFGSTKKTSECKYLYSNYSLLRQKNSYLKIETKCLGENRKHYPLPLQMRKRVWVLNCVVRHQPARSALPWRPCSSPNLNRNAGTLGTGLIAYTLAGTSGPSRPAGDPPTGTSQAPQPSRVSRHPWGSGLSPQGLCPRVLLQTHPLYLVSPESTFYLLLNDHPKAQIQSCLL